MWSKVEKTQNDHNARKVRQRPSVSRSPDRPKQAYVLIPMGLVTASRASVYTNGKSIAIEFSEDGEFSVRRVTKSSGSMRVTVPVVLADMIPLGITEPAWEVDDGRIVLHVQASA